MEQSETTGVLLVCVCVRTVVVVVVVGGGGARVVEQQLYLEEVAAACRDAASHSPAAVFSQELWTHLIRPPRSC